MRHPILAALLLFPAVGRSAEAAGVSIDHKPVGCVVVERFSKIEARFDPAGDVARARVHFRAAGGPYWYFAEMRPEAGTFYGVLPKPKKETKKIEYYVEVLGKAFAASRTAEYAPDVVEPGTCRKDVVMAAALTTAKVAVGAATGAPVVPLGFSAAGIVPVTAAGTAAGASTGGATSSAGAGATGAGAGAAGGISTGVVLGVVGAGAAVAAVAATAGGGESPATTAPGTTAPPGPAPTTTSPPATTPPPTTAPAVPCPACYAGAWEFRATTVTCGTLCGACSPGQALVGSLTVNADGTFFLPETECDPPGTIDAAGNVNFVLAGDTCPGSPPGLTCPAGTGTGRCSDTRTCAGTAEQGGEQITWTMTKQ